VGAHKVLRDRFPSDIISVEMNLKALKDQPALNQALPAAMVVVHRYSGNGYVLFICTALFPIPTLDLFPLSPHPHVGF
jgi:hypothetical protein